MPVALVARRLLLVHVAALAVAAGVIGLHGWSSDRTLPPGLVILGTAAVVVGFLRRPPAALVGVAATLLVALNLVDEPPTAGTVALGILLAAALLAGLGSTISYAISRRGATATSGRAPYLQIVSLLVLSPIWAEYLSAYDDSTGDPWQLISGLWIFVPLYGCAALLIREVSRRARLGWVGILLLGVAFGVVQAGLVDQSLFSPAYRDIDGWDETYRATLIAPLGISAVNALGFVVGHAVASIGAPIALVEAARPTTADRPWLTWRGLLLTALAYVAGSVFVLRYHLQTETWHAGAGQLFGAAVVVVGCVIAAVRLGRRPRRTSRGRLPSLPVLLLGFVLLALVHDLAPQTWTGVAVTVATLLLAGVAIARLSRRPAWSPTHTALVAAAPLLVTAAMSFTYPPLVGEVSPSAKYAHNAVMAAIVLGATALAALRRPRGNLVAAPADLSPARPFGS